MTDTPARRGLLTPCPYCAKTAYWHHIVGLTMACTLDKDGRADFYTPCDTYDMRSQLKLKFTDKMKHDLQAAGCVETQKEFIL